MDKQTNIFERVNTWIEGAEGSIITLVTTFIPWLAPLLPAYLTKTHLVEDLNIPTGVSWAMAACVEFLGLAAVSTAFSAMRHNKQRVNRAGDKKVSLVFPVSAYIFYLVVVVTVNVILGIPVAEEYKIWLHLAAIALLTLISAPAFVIAVARQEQHKIMQIAQNPVQTPVQIAQDKMQIAQRFTYDDFERDQLARNGQGPMPVDEVQERYNQKRRTAYNWLSRYHERYGIKEKN